MKKLLLAAAFGLLRFVLASFSAMAEGNSGVIPTPDQVAEYVVGKWRYGFFRVEYMPIDSSGTGHVSAAGKKGVYIPGRCGPGDKGNMLLRTDDEEACVVVQFVDAFRLSSSHPAAAQPPRKCNFILSGDGRNRKI